MQACLTGGSAASLRYVGVDTFELPRSTSASRQHGRETDGGVGGSHAGGARGVDENPGDHWWQQLCAVSRPPPRLTTLALDDHRGSSLMWVKRDGWRERMRDSDDEAARSLAALQHSFFADLAASINASSNAGWAGRLSVADLRTVLTGRCELTENDRS